MIEGLGLLTVSVSGVQMMGTMGPEAGRTLWGERQMADQICEE